MPGVNEISSDAYRCLVRSDGLVSSRILVKQTDMLVSGGSDLSVKAMQSVTRHRGLLERYIRGNPDFLHSFVPVAAESSAPDIVRTMIRAAARTDVGPMASVAGAIAEHVGKDLKAYSREVIVENGGDVFLSTMRKREVLLLAETSSFQGLRIAVDPSESMGICTSSGTIGPSFSFGRADAVTIVAESAALADAAATAVGNIVQGPEDIERALDKAREIGVDGAVILVGDHLGAWGRVEIVE